MNTILLIATIYGSIVSNDFVKAPYSVKIGEWVRVTETVSEAEANSVGYKMMEDCPPPCDTNHYAVATGWAETNRIYRVYEVREVPPPPPHRFYKYDISVAAMEYGEITNLITFISADIGTKWMWDAAEIIVADDPYFIAATNEVVKSGVVSGEKVRKILERAWELGKQTNAED